MEMLGVFLDAIGPKQRYRRRIWGARTTTQPMRAWFLHTRPERLEDDIAAAALEGEVVLSRRNEPFPLFEHEHACKV